ncbi:MAG TPA: guanylate kinase [Polyangiaceae bacterium]
MSSSASETPLLLIVSSPSGAGKTTLTTRLMQQVPALYFSVSHTTRKPRAAEQDGREYHFVSRETFEKLIELDEFLEWAEVHGNLYGTSRAEVTRRSAARGIIFDVDHQGARQIKSADPRAVTVFILPPSMELLEQRLRGRASEDEATVQRRFAVAREEIAHYGMFDYLLVNENLDEATAQLISIFRAEECRRQRTARAAERMLAESRRLTSGGNGDKQP